MQFGLNMNFEEGMSRLLRLVVIRLQRVVEGRNGVRKGVYIQLWRGSFERALVQGGLWGLVFFGVY